MPKDNVFTLVPTILIVIVIIALGSGFLSNYGKEELKKGLNQNEEKPVDFKISDFSVVP